MTLHANDDEAEAFVWPSPTSDDADSIQRCSHLGFSDCVPELPPRRRWGMALKKSFTTRSRVAVVDAVHKVTAITIIGDSLEAQVRVYADLASSRDGTPPIEDTVVRLPYDKKADRNAHTQAYRGLKELVTDRTTTQDAEGKDVVVEVKAYADAADV